MQCLEWVSCTTTWAGSTGHHLVVELHLDDDGLLPGIGGGRGVAVVVVAVAVTVSSSEMMEEEEGTEGVETGEEFEPLVASELTATATAVIAKKFQSPTS